MPLQKRGCIGRARRDVCTDQEAPPCAVGRAAFLTHSEHFRSRP
jgi:hypothetical protein